MAKKTKTHTEKASPKASKKNDVAQPQQPRQLKAPDYRSFRLQKRIRSSTPKLKGGFKLLKSSLQVLLGSWKPFVIIAVVYVFLQVIMVQSFSNVDLTKAKDTLESAVTGGWAHLAGGFSLFALLVGSSSGGATESAALYQFIIVLICSLAVVWTLRQVAAGRVVRGRDGFYQGMYPLVPVLLVLLVVLLQLLPMLIGTYIYNVAGPPATHASGAEWVVWTALLFLLVVLSVYMLCSSLFAMYVACLPGMQPMAALRSARKLVKYRRWMVMRRVLFLPLVLFAVGAVIMIPIILLLTPAAVWVFFGLSALVLPIVHSYLYALYRELLG